MSERQARIKRKDSTQNDAPKKKSSVLGNVIITVVILAFLGLGGYALKDNLKALIPEKPEKTPTVTDMAKERDMSVEDFLKEYGLEDGTITKDSTEQDLLGVFTVENYAKYQDKTVEDLLSEYQIEGAAADMKWNDAFQLMPMSKYAEMMGATFEDLKAQSGLPEEITEKTTLAETQKIMQEAQESAQTEETPAETPAE